MAPGFILAWFAPVGEPGGLFILFGVNIALWALFSLPALLVVKALWPRLSKQTRCGFSIALLFSVLFGAGGGLVAVGLNWVLPGYYPAVFDDPFYGPGVGILTGIIQGLTLGLFVGATMAIDLSWRKKLQVLCAFRTMRTILLFAALFSVGGTIIGCSIAVYFPNYYQDALAGGWDPYINPIHVGIGLGCSQGLIVGVIVGTGTTLTSNWYHRILPRNAGGA
jgi:hypothetical protein